MINGVVVPAATKKNMMEAKGLKKSTLDFYSKSSTDNPRIVCPIYKITLSLELHPSSLI